MEKMKPQRMVVINDTIETSWESWSITKIDPTCSDYNELTITFSRVCQNFYEELVKLSQYYIKCNFGRGMVFTGDTKEFSAQSKGVDDVDVTIKLHLFYLIRED